MKKYKFKFWRKCDFWNSRWAAMTFARLLSNWWTNPRLEYLSTKYLKCSTQTKTESKTISMLRVQLHVAKNLSTNTRRRIFLRHWRILNFILINFNPLLPKQVQLPRVFVEYSPTIRWVSVDYSLTNSSPYVDGLQWAIYTRVADHDCS